MKFSRRGPPDITPSQELCTVVYTCVYMASKYMKIKQDGKWSFVPIPDFRSEVKMKNLCECKRCRK